jgi:hypothetical protein
MKRCALFLLLVSLLTLCACGEREALDRRMEVLCKSDGGATVYETVQLSPDMVDQHGGLKVEIREADGARTSTYASAYVETQRTTVIKEGNPLKGQGRLVRWSYTMTRLSDGKILGASVQYSRAGGDGFHLGHHSQTLCPKDQKALFDLVFKK